MATQIAMKKEDEEELKAEDDIEAKDITFTHKHRSFLDMVFNALTDGLEMYTLTEPMKNIPYADEVADDLVEWEYLEKAKFGNNEVYYKPTKKAELELERDLPPEEGGEHGSESALHRIGVRLTATYYEQQGYEVEMYHTPDGTQDKVDLYAKPTEDSPDDREKYVVVETTPEHKSHVGDDYKTLSAFHGADAVWVVENLKEAKKLYNSLSGYTGGLSSAEINNFEKLNEHLSANGANVVHSINTIRSELRK